MMHAKLESVQKARATLRRAKHESWKAFAAFNNDPLHQEQDVLALGICVQVLSNVYDLLRDDPDDMETVAPILKLFRRVVFEKLSHTVLRLNEAAANDQSAMTMQNITSLKHSTESALCLSSSYLLRMFKVFGIQLPDAGEKSE